MPIETSQIDGVSRRAVLKAAPVGVGMLGVTAPTAAARGVIKQTEDVFGQGPGGPVVAEDGATLRRTPNGISMSLSMPTPEPGTYTYPSAPEGGAWTDEEGPPEVFTLWCFVFDPDQPPFNPPDAEWTRVFSVAGHVVGGSTLTLSGRVSTNTDPFDGAMLENPKEAEVHLAVAPHGALDPELLPEALNTPTGPGPDIWFRKRQTDTAPGRAGEHERTRPPGGARAGGRLRPRTARAGADDRHRRQPLGPRRGRPDRD